MTDTERCEFCGETFAKGSTDLPFHWYCEHLDELDDEQFRAAWIEHNVRLLDSIDVDVPVAIPRDTWEDVVEASTDEADPKEVTPGDISKDTFSTSSTPSTTSRSRAGISRHPKSIRPNRTCF